MVSFDGRKTCCFFLLNKRTALHWYNLLIHQKERVAYIFYPPPPGERVRFFRKGHQVKLSLSHGACAEVDSDTEAVAGKGFKLGCISCKMRPEVEASATVDWYFKAKGEADFAHIYNYDEEGQHIVDERFEDRVDWSGSKQSQDIQDASIYVFNVTFNDSGTYRCFFHRLLTYEFYEYQTVVSKVVHLKVVAKATRGTASIVSEVMMYVSIIGLQAWLYIEMVYCYRKISAAGEEALRESANAEYLALAPESKDNCAGVQVAE